MTETDPFFDKVFAELSSRCDDDGYTYADEADIDRWTAERAVHWTVFMDQLATELAKRYHHGEINFAFGDSLANDVWGEMITRSTGRGNESDWADLFHEVYEAFDAGEFHRPADGDADPVKLYTDPAITEIVAKLA